MIDKQKNFNAEPAHGSSMSSRSDRQRNETRSHLLQILKPLQPIEDDMQRYDCGDPMDTDGNAAILSHMKNGNAPLLRKIWGDVDDHAVLAANSMQHVSLFCIPAIAASAHLIQKNRYREDSAFALQSSKTAEFLHDVTIAQHDENFSTFAIAHHHLPPNDRQAANLPPKTVHQKPVQHKHGIPHAVMAYSFYESLRAAEFIAEHKGITLTQEEKNEHYRYFSEILRRSGYRCPTERAEMESIAERMDALAGMNPTNVDLMKRTLAHLNTYPNNLVLFRVPRSSLAIPREWIHSFLRPLSQKVFDEIDATNAEV